jgi:tRNA threonylcarbamoyladenosine biosynthesis protein TsaE
MTISALRTLQTEVETRLMGLALGRVLRGGDVVLLEGALGAGKTTLVRAVVEGMGLDVSPVSSPTFVVVHEYRRGGAGGGREDAPELIHVDAYRLRGAEELESLGWDRVLERIRGRRAALVVEWPERLAEPPPVEPARVRLEHAGEFDREAALELPESWRGRAGLEEVLNRRATRCRVTGKLVPPDSPTYPFSSERARLADLHRWFSGSYQISRELSEEDLEEPRPPES